MGEFLMFLGVLSLGLITVNPMLGMVVPAVLLVAGGNECCKGGR